jgi:hypothetical protein
MSLKNLRVLKSIFILSFIFFSNSKSFPEQNPVSPQTQTPQTPNVIPNPPPTENYTLRDLEILSSEKNYVEFFDHALDLRPSSRDNYWKEMVHTMSEGFVKEMVKSQNYSLETFNRVNALFNWPILKTNEFFLQERERFGEGFFSHCLNGKLVMSNLSQKNNLNLNNLTSPSSQNQMPQESCLTYLHKFWFESPKNPYFGLALAKMLARSKNQFKNPPLTHQDLWVLVEKSPKSDFSHFLCQDTLVQELLFQEITKKLVELEWENKSMPQIPQVKKLMSDLINNDCFNQIKESYLTQFKKAEGTNLGSERQNHLYLILMSQNALDLGLQDFYLVLNLLQRPSLTTQGVDDLFNQAWNTLISLSKNVDRRQELLSKLKNIDPLPGQLFDSLNNLEGDVSVTKKQQVILNHFETNFPEYLDYYAKTCLSYLEGKKIFSNGNPTPECPNFLKLVQKGKSQLDPMIVKKSFEAMEKFTRKIPQFEKKSVVRSGLSQKEN